MWLNIPYTVHEIYAVCDNGHKQWSDKYLVPAFITPYFAQYKQMHI